MLLSLALSTSAYILLVAGPPAHRVDVEVLVLDELTKQPVEGVRVLVEGEWREFLGSGSLSYEKVVVSDQNGKVRAEFDTDYPVKVLSIRAWDFDFHRYGIVSQMLWTESFQYWLWSGGVFSPNSTCHTVLAVPGIGKRTVILKQQTPDQQARWQRYANKGILW